MHRDGDRLLQLLIFNEEFLVSACHQRALITSLPFVHTARRSYRLNDPVRPPDCSFAAGSPAARPREAVQTLSFRGRRSRNKVSVGEPAEGSLPVFPPAPLRTVSVFRARTVSLSERVLCASASASVRGVVAQALLARPAAVWPPRLPAVACPPLERRAARVRVVRVAWPLPCLQGAVLACVSRVAPVRPPLELSQHTTLVDGYLGSRNDEERSEMRYVVRIAEFSESSNL